MSYLLIIVVLGLLILVHEAGHLWAALLAGIPIERFSIGFGPKLFGWRRGETEYVVSAIPIGGYCMPALEDEESFWRIPVSKRIVFSLGGPLANLICSLLLLAVLDVTVQGWSVGSLLLLPMLQTWQLTVDFITSLPQLFAQPNQLSGVVGIVAQGGQYVGMDLIKILQFAIILNLNLFIFNLIPIPAMDGGKVVLYLLELIHPKLVRLQVPMAILGWVIMIGLLVYVTALDIGRLIPLGLA